MKKLIRQKLASSNLDRDEDHTKSRGWALTTTLRTPSRQLPQVGLKKDQPYQNFPLPAFPADALSRVTENEPYHLPARLASGRVNVECQC